MRLGAIGYQKVLPNASAGHALVGAMDPPWADFTLRLVPKMGLEPIRPQRGQRCLRPPRLPFRHSGSGRGR
jgi:hypothetical protein